MTVTGCPDNTVKMTRMHCEEVPEQLEPASTGIFSRRNPSVLRAAGAAGLAVVFAASFFLPFNGLGISTCAFRNTFSIPCPGCGLTRSFVAISHGEFAAAMRWHPLGILIYCGMFVYMVKWAIEALLKRRLLSQLEGSSSVPALWTLIFSLTGVWLLRLITGVSC